MLFRSGIADALTGAGIRLTSLATNREILPVPLAAVTLDFFKTLNVAAIETSQGPFDEVFLVDGAGEFGDFVVGEIFGPALGIDPELGAQFERCRRADALEVSQTDMGRFVRRDVDALKTRHV